MLGQKQKYTPIMENQMEKNMEMTWKLLHMGLYKENMLQAFINSKP